MEAGGANAAAWALTRFGLASLLVLAAQKLLLQFSDFAKCLILSAAQALLAATFPQAGAVV